MGQAFIASSAAIVKQCLVFAIFDVRKTLVLRKLQQHKQNTKTLTANKAGA